MEAAAARGGSQRTIAAVALATLLVLVAVFTGGARAAANDTCAVTVTCGIPGAFTKRRCVL